VYGTLASLNYNPGKQSLSPFILSCLQKGKQPRASVFSVSFAAMSIFLGATERLKRSFHSNARIVRNARKALRKKKYAVKINSTQEAQ